MGCGGSVPEAPSGSSDFSSIGPPSPHSSPNSGGAIKKKKKQPLTKKEIDSRIDAPKSARRCRPGGLDADVAWVSQRGYYPDCKSFCLSS